MRHTSAGLTLTSIAVLLLAGCGGGGGGGGGATPGTTNITGRVTFARIMFGAAANAGLNYADSVQQPARGVVVRALAAGTQTVLASTTTNDSGSYTLSVPGNTNINVVAVAQMLRDSSQASPHWDVRTQDVDTGGTPYTYASISFNSSAGTAHDLAIPAGFSASGVVNGTRASAPFAILDTVYQGMQTVLAVAPTIDFPALVLDWAPDNPAGETFFDPNDDTIVLAADPARDTDEFDQHVIAHEFGHYLEANFARADNIGGAHGLGDRLDVRTAFGEGFGYAFGAMVLNDPVTRDSGVEGGVQVSSTFNVEVNPAGADRCWCSEASVWSILWDIYDNTQDANDTVALGFAPIWNLLIGPQATTDSLTTIFSFTAAFKSANASSATAINSLVAAQQIDAATIDAFATTETHVPTGIASASAALPLFTNITRGGPAVVVQSAGTAQLNYNKLGNHRFLRLQHSGTPSTLTIRVATNGTDADFKVFRNGMRVAAAEEPAAPSETLTLSDATAGTYIIDVYECGNGCSPVNQQGTTPGNFNLTVTVN